jgi:hypothetical protein
MLLVSSLVLDLLLLKAKAALSLGKPSLDLVASNPRGGVLWLGAEGAAGVLHSVSEPVALDPLNAMIPRAGLDRIGGPLPQLLDDVGGRLDPGGRECLR